VIGVLPNRGAAMHVISQKMLRQFWAAHPDAEEPLRAWHRTVEAAEWDRFADLREVYPNADQVGRCIVFNIAGNKYRLIAAIHFNRRKVFVLAVLTHKVYDKDKWKDEFGCC
jgi:mRNA interferase HigB